MHPLLGVGPDNFRHYYGAELGLEAWDERVQANNMYLEVLADLGVLGLAAFAWVVVGPLRGAWHAARGGELDVHSGTSRAPRELTGAPALAGGAGLHQATAATDCQAAAYLALGVGLSIVAFLVHGLLDAFLVFNPTVWLFWLLLGFASVWGGGPRR
jgi:O-antigen ligase